MRTVTVADFEKEFDVLDEEKRNAVFEAAKDPKRSDIFSTPGGLPSVEAVWYTAKRSMGTDFLKQIKPLIRIAKKIGTNNVRIVFAFDN